MNTNKLNYDACETLKDALLNSLSEMEFTPENTVIYSDSYKSCRAGFYLELMDSDSIDEFVENEKVFITDFEIDETLNKLRIDVSIFELENLEGDGVRICETTSALNDYPKDTKKVLTWFRDWSQAQELLDEYPFLEAVKVSKKEGRCYWREEYSVDAPFSTLYQLDTFGDDWYIWEEDRELEYLKDRISEMGGQDDYDLCKEYEEDKFNRFLERYKELSADETLITDGCDYEIIKPVMDFCEDNNQYAIALKVKD